MSAILAPYERRRRQADRCHSVGCLIAVGAVVLLIAGAAVALVLALEGSALLLLTLSWCLREVSRRALVRDLDERIESSRENLGGEWGSAPGDRTRR